MLPYSYCEVALESVFMDGFDANVEFDGISTYATA